MALAESDVTSRRLHILIVDDHDVVRQGLRTLLQAQWGWNVCGEARSGDQAVAKARELRPHVIVIESRLPGIDGIQAVRQILSDRPGTEILLLVPDESMETIRAASETGARGILAKSDAARDLVTAVTALSRHEEFYSTSISEIIRPGNARALGTGRSESQPAHAGLTKREREIVILVCEGRSNKQVAGQLNISPKTVESHRRNLMHKLELRSTAELVRYAVRNGLVRP